MSESSLDECRDPMRGRFTPAFRRGLKVGGIQRRVVDAALCDKKLDIQLRDNYIDIYYRGGKILGIGSKSWFFDKYYFYFGEDYIPKTHLKEIANGRRKDILCSRDAAQRVIAALEEKCKRLTDLLPQKPKEYFEEAKRVMDAWLDRFPKPEREDQQKITMKNRTIETDSSLAIIDIEFAVSTLKEYNRSTNSSGKPKVCRFDMIAVDGTGQVYVIELKQNSGAENSATSDMKAHLRDFEDTVSESSDRSHSFVKEMKYLLQVKQELGIAPADLLVDTDKGPVFVAVYSGVDCKESITDAWRKLGIKILSYHDYIISL